MGIFVNNNSKTSNLSNLLSEGADAMSNLFEIAFILEDNNPQSLNNTDISKSLCYRTNNFVTPERTANHIALPFQNTILNKIVPGSNLDKVLKLDIRLDTDYTIYNWLQNLNSIDYTGSFKKDSKKILAIEVNALDSSFNIKYTWIFSNCSFLGMLPLTYQYDNSSSLHTVATFIYEEYKEYKP